MIYYFILCKKRTKKRPSCKRWSLKIVALFHINVSFPEKTLKTILTKSHNIALQKIGVTQKIKNLSKIVIFQSPYIKFLSIDLYYSFLSKFLRIGYTM